MGRKLRYLGPTEWAEIEKLHNGGTPAAKIAERIGYHTATIYKGIAKQGPRRTPDSY